VVPLPTVAKILRVESGITLNPNAGCATVIPTPGPAGGDVGGGDVGGGDVGGGDVGGGNVGGGDIGGGGSAGTVTLTITALQLTTPRLHVRDPLPAALRLEISPPETPELIVKNVDPPFDHVTICVQSVTLESE
jgi:hypothetical protein